MSRIRLSKLLLVITAWVVTSAAIAQPFLGTSSKNPQTSTAKKTPVTTPALSPQEFGTQVNVQSKKAQQDLFRQAQTNLTQQTNQMPLPNSPPKPLAPGIGQPGQSTTTPTHNAASSSQNNNGLPQSAALPASTAPSTSSSDAAQTNNTQTPAPTQNQPYTGFGGDTTQQQQQPNSSTPSSQSSGGWSIKY